MNTSERDHESLKIEEIVILGPTVPPSKTISIVQNCLKIKACVLRQMAMALTGLKCLVVCAHHLSVFLTVQRGCALGLGWEERIPVKRRREGERSAGQEKGVALKSCVKVHVYPT